MSKGEVTRRLIVDRALELATQLGLEGLSLGTLATDLSLSKSGLFAHFKSKETLQLAVLDSAIERFVSCVVAPAVREPRGEPRVRAMFENWFGWITEQCGPGGCLFMSLSHEYDDRPGAIRDKLASAQRDWWRTLSKAAQLAIDAGHFRRDLDAEQFAQEVLGIGMAYQHATRLLHDPRAEKRARTAFAALVERSKKPSSRH
jgi:AcrR family transcriptional regulator